MQNIRLILMSLALTGALTGCAHDNANAPCSHFGATCTKAPVNSWNVNQ